MIRRAGQYLRLRGMMVADAARALTLSGKKVPWLLLSALSPLPTSFSLKRFISWFAVRLTEEEVLYDFGAIQMEVPREFLRADRWYLVHQYFEIVYPALFGSPSRFFSKEGPYERKEVIVEPGDIVVDAGASIGFFSVVAAKKAGPQGKVYAFEPFGRACEYLRRNAGHNGCRNIAAVPMALGACDGRLTLFGDGPASRSGARKKDGGEMSVPQIPLDAYVRDRGVSRVDFIKMDVEGMERKVLEGARETIRRYRPKLSLCSYHLPDDPEVLERMVREIEPGYRMVREKGKMYAWFPR